MKHRLAAAGAVSICTAVILAVTADDYGLTVDEPTYVAAADRLCNWFAGLVGAPGIVASFQDEAIEKSWGFAQPENYNLPVPALISAAGHAITRGFLSPLISYRVGHCLLLAATAGVLFWCSLPSIGERRADDRQALDSATIADRRCNSPRISEAWGWEAAAVSVGSLLLMPQVFAHGHLNATDIPAACFWLLAILTWLRSESSWPWRFIAAVACGLGLATKATFVLLPVLLVVWVVAFRRWTWWRACLGLIVVSPIVMLACCPMWWAAPISRLTQYYQSVFSEPIWKIEVYYLGQTYILGTKPIPWHSAIVLPVITTPPWTLVLAIVGALHGLRSRPAAIGLWLLGACVLPVLRILPGTPAHDGVRLLMPSLFCLGPLAGYGFMAVTERFRLNSVNGTHTWIRLGLVLSLLAVGTCAVVSMHPHEMSYYSELVGGLRGAERLGFEVSYWFEGYTTDSLREVQEHLPHGARVWTYPQYPGYPLLRKWHLWREDLADGDIGAADYLILYTQKSRFYAIDGIERIYQYDRPIWSLECRGVQIMGLYKL